MAANKIIKGRDLMLFDNDGHSYAYATNHTLTITAETVDVSSKDHGVWGASEVSKYSWEITSENLFTSEDYDKLFDSMLASKAITVRFGLKKTYYEGKVIITSLVANANNGENATYSVTLTGTGSIKKTTTPE